MSDKLTVMQRTTLARLQNMIGQLADMGVSSGTWYYRDGDLRGLILFESDPLGLFLAPPATHPPQRPRPIQLNGLRLVLSQTDEEDDG